MKIYLTMLALACHATESFAADFGKEDLVRDDRMVYEKSFTQAESDRFRPLIQAAFDRVAAFYGERQGVTPDIYFCKSAACARFLLGPEFRSYSDIRGGQRYLNGRHLFDNPSIVVTTLASNAFATDARLLSVLSHELSHLELYARAAGRHVPAWFNEGLASMVGGRACTPGASGIDDLSKLSAMRDWLDHTRSRNSQSNATYCQAKAEVEAWAVRHGGPKGIVALLAGLREKDFASQYGALLTRPLPAINPRGARENDR
ncbi:hypothetical protein [Pseudoduganella sp. HUAS MS19]